MGIVEVGGGRTNDLLDPSMVWPPVRVGPEPDPALKDEILADFQEARAVALLSPRSAAALLRLALQKLLKQIGQLGKNINADIAALVEQGLRVDVQKASDIVRLTGNDAVHPGDINAGDPETVMPLFDLVNFIADDLISRPNRLESFWQTIPEEKRNWVEDRDKATDDT
jgi:hypothetical protein